MTDHARNVCVTRSISISMFVSGSVSHEKAGGWEVSGDGGGGERA